MSKDKSVGKNVSMYQADWQYVEQVAKEMGLSTSAAVRFIVNRDRKANPAPRPGKPEAG